MAINLKKLAFHLYHFRWSETVQRWGLPSTIFNFVKNGAGFTLLEILVVTAILFTVAGASLSYVGSNYQRNYLTATGIEVRATLSQANKFAQQGFLDREHGVYFSKSNQSYTLYAGPSFATRDSDYDFVQYWNSNVNLSSPVATTFELNFAKNSGTTTPTTLIFQTAGGETETIVVNSLGVIE